MAEDNYNPVFQTLPNSSKEKWNLVRDLIYQWYKIDLDVNPRGPLQNYPTKFLGYELPYSVKEWVCLAEALAQKGAFGIFRDDFSVSEITEISAISLLVQSEGDLYFVIEQKHLGLEDPPVEVYYFNEEDTLFAYRRREAESVTDFALLHLIYCLHGKGGGFGIHMQITEEFIKKLKNSFDTFLKIGDLTVFERQNMIGYIFQDQAFDIGYIHFEIWKELPEPEIPACIWEIDRTKGGSFHGMMIPPHDK